MESVQPRRASESLPGASIVHSSGWTAFDRHADMDPSVWIDQFKARKFTFNRPDFTGGSVVREDGHRAVRSEGVKGRHELALQPPRQCSAPQESLRGAAVIHVCPTWIPNIKVLSAFIGLISIYLPRDRSPPPQAPARIPRSAQRPERPQHRLTANASARSKGPARCRARSGPGSQRSPRGLCTPSSGVPKPRSARPNYVELLIMLSERLQTPDHPVI